MLGAKERALLLALSETEYCTSGTLAKALGVSSKTAQGMVKDLREKLQENGADILARTRHGYLLQVNDRALFETLSSGENAAAHFIPSGSEERVRYLLVLLLGQVDYVKLDDVSEELYVSKYTISGDLHQVEEELAKYHLSILRRPNYGIRVTGREIDIRGTGTMKEFEYTVQDQLGIHARPAGQIAKLAKAHPDCEISFAKIGGSKTANAARVMALMSLGAKPGDVLHITVEGANEESVTTAMQELLNSEKL